MKEVSEAHKDTPYITSDETIRYVAGPKQNELLKLLNSVKATCVVLVADNIEQWVLMLWLQAQGIDAQAYHSNLNEERAEVSHNFRQGKTRVLIISFMMGVCDINLQGEVSLMYMMSIPFNQSVKEQAIARIARYGSSKQVVAVMNVLKYSFDTTWESAPPRRQVKA